MPTFTKDNLREAFEAGDAYRESFIQEGNLIVSDSNDRTYPKPDFEKWYYERFEERVKLRYTDYQFCGIADFYSRFREVFLDLLPGSSGKSFQHHMGFYMSSFILNDRKETIVEEIKRFRSYIINKYKLKEDY